MKNGKSVVRVEHQEYPNQEVADVVIRRLFPDGHLIDVDNLDSKARDNQA
jgi:hypothetical protein